MNDQRHVVTVSGYTPDRTAVPTRAGPAAAASRVRACGQDPPEDQRTKPMTNGAAMSHTEQVNPLDLREGDLIDLTPLFDAADVSASEGDRMFAECELARVESVEPVESWTKDPIQRLILIHNDQCNIAVPENQPVTRTVG